ncbi:unnamed protein product, partial [Mesorhabditis belari]|uniref:Uncharacterized protein n=1 Tax=Mesorhabditis belari TaxID=2138241 RepID=A0AAF3EZ47_9BILA
MVGLEMNDEQMTASMRMILAGANPQKLIELVVRKRREQERNVSISSSSQHSQNSSRGGTITRIVKSKHSEPFYEQL